LNQGISPGSLLINSSRSLPSISALFFATTSSADLEYPVNQYATYRSHFSHFACTVIGMFLAYVFPIPVIFRSYFFKAFLIGVLFPTVVSFLSHQLRHLPFRLCSEYILGQSRDHLPHFENISPTDTPPPKPPPTSFPRISPVDAHYTDSSDSIFSVSASTYSIPPLSPAILELIPTVPNSVPQPISVPVAETDPVPQQSQPPLAPLKQKRKRKYKPVAKKIKSVVQSLPEEFRVIRKRPSDPLLSLPKIPPNPPDFVPTPHMTQDRMDTFRLDDNDFLWPQEKKLLKHIAATHEQVFAYNQSERRRFRSDYFPPVKFPVIEHTPWVHKNLPIPPGVRDELIDLLKQKVAAGVYEPSSSAYRTRWFCVVKKDRRNLRIVHDLQPLNQVTIRDSGVIPTPDQFSEQCAGRACIGNLDLFSSYDLQLVHPDSRDTTTFQTPLGTFRLVSLPMGWTNAVAIQQGNLVFILLDEIPEHIAPFIDDVVVLGPRSRYQDKDGNCETHPENPGIRRFIWEYAQVLNRGLHRLNHAGASCSGNKVILCAPETTVVGYRCSFNGRLPENSNVQRILDWPDCQNLSEVRAFLGTCGVSRMWIKNYAHIARPLNNLLKKDLPFVFDDRCQTAMVQLKTLVASAPCLRPIDYKSGNPVILAVDSSVIAVGYILLQLGDDSRRYPSRYGSISWNSRESNYSQAKLELYGLFRALHAVRLHIFGLSQIVVEVDAKYIKGMLNNPDIQPNATINRWIAAILLFNPEIIHVPAERHTGADGLSRRPPHPDELSEISDHDDWLDRAYGFAIEIVNYFPNRLTPTIPLYNSEIRTSFISPISSPEEIFFSDRGDSPTPSIPDFDNSDEPSDDLILPPRSQSAQFRDAELPFIMEYLRTLQVPDPIPPKSIRYLIRRAAHFFILEDRLFRRDTAGKHKAVIFDLTQRVRLIREAHDNLGHKGFHPVRLLLLNRYWWPSLEQDVKWYIRTCHQCQIRQTTKLHLPPTVASIPSLFRKAYVDTMVMPKSRKMRYIIQARCGLTSWPEWRMYGRETGAAVGKFIFEELLCRWGVLTEIVTDNGSTMVAGVDWLRIKYGITHIRISSYNSQAAGNVERKHFDVRSSIMKAAPQPADWPLVIHSVFWAERVTIKRTTGMSPFYMVHGVEPLLPLDIAEATYLLPPLQPWLTTENLIALRARQLQKRPEDLELVQKRIQASRFKSAQQFRDRFRHTIFDYDFQPGELVLVRDTRVEKDILGRKIRPRYFGPVVIVRRHSSNGSYIIAELDGSISIIRCAAFRVIPYFPRENTRYNISRILENADEHLTEPETLPDDVVEDPEG